MFCVFVLFLFCVVSYTKLALFTRLYKDARSTEHTIQKVGVVFACAVVYIYRSVSCST